MKIDEIVPLIESIDESMRSEVMELDKADRSMVLGIVAAALSSAADSLSQYRAKLEASGEATPVSDEQKQSLRSLLFGAKKAS